MHLYDEIKGSCDLSTSDYEDTAWIRCESTWTWFYGNAMIFLWGICADSYESAILRFWERKIALNLGVMDRFSPCGIFFLKNILSKMIGLYTFEIWQKWVQIRYLFCLCCCTGHRDDAGAVTYIEINL